MFYSLKLRMHALSRLRGVQSAVDLCTPQLIRHAIPISNGLPLNVSSYCTANALSPAPLLQAGKGRVRRIRFYFSLNLLSGFTFLVALSYVGLGFGLSASLPSIAIANESPVTGFNRTFIQLSHEHVTWSESDWAQLFKALNELKIAEVIVQWSALDEQAYTTAQPQHSSNRPVIPALLDGATKSGIHVILGLQADSNYWSAIRQTIPALEGYFRRRLAANESLIKSLIPIVKEYDETVSGWYIADEIDDVNWRTPEAISALFAYLKQLHLRLRGTAPARPVAISGFSNGALDPELLAEFWQRLLSATGIHRVFFQDGIGAHKLKLHELPLYLLPLQRAVVDGGRELAVVIELYTQVAGPPLTDEPFRAIPAPITRLREQLNVAKRFALESVAFSVPDYMTPFGSAPAQKLYADYSRVLNGKSP